MLEKLAKKFLSVVFRGVPFKKMFEMRGDEASRQPLRDLIAEVIGNGHNKITMVEIGSYRGESAEVFLSTGLVERIYCVDPWRMNYDSDDGASYTDMKKVEDDFDRRHGNDSRVVKVKGTIDDFVARYMSDPSVEGTIDLVYIDGCHTYEAVVHDIDVARAQIRPRLALAGHDYCSGVWPGSSKAITERIGAPDRVFADTSWMKMSGSER